MTLSASSPGTSGTVNDVPMMRGKKENIVIVFQKLLCLALRELPISVPPRSSVQFPKRLRDDPRGRALSARRAAKVQVEINVRYGCMTVWMGTMSLHVFLWSKDRLRKRTHTANWFPSWPRHLQAQLHPCWMQGTALYLQVLSPLFSARLQQCTKGPPKVNLRPGIGSGETAWRTGASTPGYFYACISSDACMQVRCRQNWELRLLRALRSLHTSHPPVTTQAPLQSIHRSASGLKNRNSALCAGKMRILAARGGWSWQPQMQQPQCCCFSSFDHLQVAREVSSTAKHALLDLTEALTSASVARRNGDVVELARLKGGWSAQVAAVHAQSHVEPASLHHRRNIYFSFALRGPTHSLMVKEIAPNPSISSSIVPSHSLIPFLSPFLHASPLLLIHIFPCVILW